MGKNVEETTDSSNVMNQIYNFIWELSKDKPGIIIDQSTRYFL